MEHRNSVYYYRKLISALAENNGCWEWTKARNKDGYGQISYKGKHTGTHLLMLVLLGSHKPEYVIDHICRNKACCNPKHLRQVTKRENSLENSVSPAAKNAKKTHCSKGHPFNKANTGHGKNRRYCKQCNREKAVRYRARRNIKSTHQDLSLSQIQLFS